ncbi:1-phosphatidylinositol phosphodiesterase-like [Glandiceps talaboti]
MGDTKSKLHYDPNWMSRIPDGRSLANLSIPGTHNTMTFEGSGGPIARCQSTNWTLCKQLEAGIRFLDIRCRHFSNCLTIHHGQAFQNAHFEDVLHDVIKFLSKHSSEVIIMRVKEEHEHVSNSRSMKSSLEFNVCNYGGKWFYRSPRTNNPPKIGDVRGKIVILDDFDGSSDFICYSSLKIEDHYHVSTILPSSIDAKFDYVKAHLQKARHGRTSTLYLTFSSGTGLGAYPDAVAGRINPKLMQYLRRYPGRNRWGMIAMDFPAAEIVEAIIKSNY